MINILANATTDQIKQGVSDAAGGSPSTAPASDLATTITNVLNTLSAVVGVLAVLMIIYAGFRYVTSAGNQEATKTARNTIVYAIVGLAVVALSEFIVHFVITNL